MSKTNAASNPAASKRDQLRAVLGEGVTHNALVVRAAKGGR